MRRNFEGIKERVLEKVASAAVPPDAFDNGRQFLETVVRDVTLAAQGLTKDALQRIKSRLVHILPSLSPPITIKVSRSLYIHISSLYIFSVKANFWMARPDESSPEK
jgi:hypothetical protein